MDDLLIRVLTRLIRIHDEFGERTFEHAANRALLAIALAAHSEAEQAANGAGAFELSTVIPFSNRRPTTEADS